jgi:hypothetical protein
VRGRVAWLERQLREQRAAREVEERFRRCFERLRALHRGHELPPEHPLGDIISVSEMIRQRDHKLKARTRGEGTT